MAEHVQASLDRMVAPLRDLMDRQIFTEEEIRAVVSRRRESEYLLRRRAARKADFVRYIEAETLLEKLRVLRTARRKRDHRKARRETGLAGDGDADDNDDNNNNNNDDDDDHEECIGDAHIVQHVHLLFVRAIRKFRGDVSLHLQHAEFCKTVGSRTRLSRVYAEALQVFPREAGIWIEAASNEFFGPNRSVKSARVLLQRALRLNGSSSEELWVQYFSLELHYAQTLRGRRTILDPSGSNGGGGGSSDDDDDENTTTATTTDYNKIPMVVLRNAIRSIPNSVRFRLTFLDVCREFPDTAGLVEYVQNSMATDFANEPESWIARAVYQAEKRREEQPNDRNSNHDHDTDTDHEPAAKRARNSKEQHGKHKRGAGVDPVVAVLRRATKTLDTSEMLLQAFRFARDYGKELEREPEQEQDGATNNQRAMKQVDAFIRTLWSKANQKRTDDFISPELAMEQTRYLLEKGKEKEAVKTIQTCCTGTKPPKNKHARVSASSSSSIPVEAWLLWASLLSSSIQKQKSILERALESISMDTHPDYVVALLQYLGVGLKMRAMIHDGEEKTNDQNGGGSDCRDGDEDDDDDNDDKATEVLLFGTLQKLLLLSPKTVEDVCIRNGSTGLEFEIGDVFSAYLLCLEAFYERGGIGGARKIYEAVLFRSTATARGALSANHADRIQEFVDRCLALELEAIEAAGLDGTNHKKRARSGVLRKLYDKAIDIFSGSPLEGPYREDRNENTIFA